MGAAREQVVEGLDPVAGDDDLVRDVVLSERPQGEQLVVGIVFDQEYDACRSSRLAPARGPASRPAPRRPFYLCERSVSAWHAALCSAVTSLPSNYAAGAFYPVRYIRVTELHPLADLVCRVAAVNHGRDGDYEAERNQHDGGYAERYYGEDHRDQGVER